MARKRRKRKSPNAAETRSVETGSSAASSTATPAADTPSAADQTATLIVEPEKSVSAKQQATPVKNPRTRRTRRPKTVRQEAAPQEKTKERPSEVPSEPPQDSPATELRADTSTKTDTAADLAATTDAVATDAAATGEGDGKAAQPQLERSTETDETGVAEATVTAETGRESEKVEAAENVSASESASAVSDAAPAGTKEPAETNQPVAPNAAIAATPPADAEPADPAPEAAESADAEPALERRTELQGDRLAELTSRADAGATSSDTASSDVGNGFRGTEGRLVAMLEIVNQLLAEQRDGLSPPLSTTPPPHTEIVDQLRQRAIELDRREAAMQARLRDLYAREDLLRYQDDRLQQREQEWVRQSTDLAARRRELAARLRQHRHLERAEQSLVDQTAQMSSVVGEVVGAFQQESTQVREVLLDAVAAIQQTVNEAQSNSSDVQQQLAEKESEVALLQEQLEQTRQSLEQNEEELRSLREASDQYLCESLFNASDDDQSSLAAQIQSLQAELDAANQRVEELQSQNGDLASKVVSNQVNSRLTNDGTQSLESLPWEERKRLILARLEDEESNLESQAQQQGEPVAAEVRDEIETLRELVQQTDREIMRRDAEIAELRQLLEQQSGTVGEVAIGAAAIAGMLDQDDLIREEREKLQAIKTEWEEKLREAEIEVSMERAKLARERQELEKRNAELEEMLAHQQREQQTEATDADGKPVRRRWLARMGLSEE